MNDVLQATWLASRRSSALVHEEMRAGVYALATIACLAPWVGVFGNVLGIINSFQGIAGEKTAGMAAVFHGLSESLWPTALGILVGLIAFWSYQYLTGQLQSLDQEMENASLDLLNQLSRFPGRFRLAATAEPRMFGEIPLDQVERDRTAARRLRFLASVAIAAAWGALEWRYFFEELTPGILQACLNLPIVLGLSCIFAYPVWVKFLHRKRGALVFAASLVCLCWTVAELLLAKSLP